MQSLRQLAVMAALAAGISVSAAQAPAPAQPPADQPFEAGPPLAMTPNARTFGGFRFAESISYDEARDLYVVPSAGMPQAMLPNDGYVSLVKPDGSAHTLKWIGVNRNGLTLNHPLGSDIMNGLLYLADMDTIRWFDMNTGAPRGSMVIPGVTGIINDVEVAVDGTVYATHTGSDDPATWRVYRISPAREVSVFASGPPLARPNGVALDPAGNVVVVNMVTADVLTYSAAGQLVKTEQSADTGNDGLVILPDGTKYVCSVRQGSVARIRPGARAEVIASGIPTPASMAYDSRRNRLVIPMNDWNAITFVELP